jgi:hypothetical protein
VRLVFEGAIPEEVDLPGIVHKMVEGHSLLLTLRDFDESLQGKFRETGASNVEVIDLNLEEIFFEVVKGDRRGGAS